MPMGTGEQRAERGADLVGGGERRAGTFQGHRKKILESPFYCRAGMGVGNMSL